ncbi:MAG: glycosyltransferase family 2 protein [Candidatus Thorarchaeota archaeon]
MKLVVMIPAFNEEQSIGRVISEIPRNISGISEVEVLVIDDGCVDNTRQVALDAGANRIESHTKNLGLASAFRTGIKTALEMNADIIVNTDADRQYDQLQIPALVQPIVNSEADLVLGSRFKGRIEEMPLGNRIGNLLATFVTRILSGYPTSDAQSGFRAFSRNLAQFLVVTSRKTYVQETIIRSARGGFTLVEMPITFRKRPGESRLISSIWGYAFNVLPDLVRCYIHILRTSNQL